MSVLKDGVTWDSEKMGSYPLEDYGKIRFPAMVVVRKQGGGFYEIGKFKTAKGLEAVIKKGLISGPDQCDRVCYYKKVAS